MLKDKIKSLVEKNVKGNSKKTIENLVVFLVLLVITVISINVIWGKDNNSNSNEQESSYAILAQNLEESNIVEKSEYNLERELENILSKISGVGKVQVLITYSQTSEVVAMHNETKNTSKTEENDSNRWYQSYRIC